MAIPESVVAAVVSEVSAQMAKDPNFAQLAVGTLVESQPDVSRFVTAQARTLGSSDAIVHVVFHANIMGTCFAQHLGRDLKRVTFPDLNEAATGDTMARLKTAEPALFDYLAANVEGEAMQELLSLIGLAFANA